MGEFDRVMICYVLLILIRDSVISDRIMGELGDVVIMSID